jgi:hypothetical protein
MSDDEEVIEHTTFAVEIEVEKMLSETDEEEDDDMDMLIISNKKKSSAERSGSASPNVKEPVSALERRRTIRESMDHLELFNHKMNRKFNKEDKRKKMIKS